MPMRTVEIARSDWSEALEEFSKIHEGWLISLDILSPDIGAQPEVSDLALIGATLDAPDGATLTVAAGRSADDHVRHPIQAPRRIWIERTDAGADAALGIESADGTKTILRFRAAALPETLDGIVRR
jgi:hypothetical protein